MDSIAQIAFFVLVWSFYVSADKTIMTTVGQVKGVTVSNKGVPVEAFLGIPYAESPVGSLRFQRPLPKKPWSGVYNADSLPPSCMQNNTGNYYEPSMDTPMSEDCLFLNLWVPHSEEDGNPKTIMVFLHGGAFVLGSSNMKLYDGANLARTGNVIVATINYRVGAFGFIFIDNTEAKGNVGLFDQILAFKWLKANAKSFGGDPDNIVPFGESAGSACVGGFDMSPLTQNMFRRAIMQSGTPVHPMSLDNNAQVSEVSRKIARFAGCHKDKTTPQKVVSCLKSLPAKAISDAEAELKKTPFNLILRAQDDFLSETVSYRLTRGMFGNMELLIGTNEAEGPFFLSAAAPEYFKDGEVNIGSRFLARGLLRSILSAVNLAKEAKGLSDYYIDLFGNGTSESYMEAIATAIGDYYIDCGSYFHAEFVSLKNPVYYYVLKRRPSSTPLGEWAKTTHFDELQYVFGNPLFDDFTPEEEAFSVKIMKRWAAFAKTGNPSIPGEEDWPRFKRDDPKYMVLSEKDSVRFERPDDGRCEIWREKFQTIVNEEVLSKFKY